MADKISKVADKKLKAADMFGKVADKPSHAADTRGEIQPINTPK